MITILEADKRSGKTTSILKFLDERAGQSIGGFLTPDVDGLRHIYRIRTKTLHSFEVQDSADQLVSVGRFTFLQSGFDAGLRWMKEDAEHVGTSLLILDEVGPLELRGGGFVRWCDAHRDYGHVDQLWVVRTGLAEEVIQHWDLENYRVIGRIFDLE